MVVGKTLVGKIGSTGNFLMPWQTFSVIGWNSLQLITCFFSHCLAKDALHCQFYRHVKGIVILEEEIPLILNLALHVMGM